MTKIGSRRGSPKRARYLWLAACPVVAGVAALVIITQPAVAAVAPVDLGTAGTFAVLAGTTVANTDASTIQGDVGVSPGTSVTGFPPGVVTGGSIVGTSAAAIPQEDLTAAYNDAAGRTASVSVGDFIGVGQTLGPGVYNAPSSLEVGGSLTLDAQGDANAVFIFQAGSTLTTDSASSIDLVNGAQACNVFWQVGSSATLGTGSTFTGTILAQASITATTGDTITGRVLASTGAVTLDTDSITVPACTTGPTPSPSPSPTSPTTTPSPSPTSPTTTPPPSPTGPPTSPTTTPPPSPTGPPTSPTTTPPPSPTGPPTSPTTTPPPSPTSPPTSPTSSYTHPAPSPTGPPTSASPTTSASPKPKPAPTPTPVSTIFPVTG